MKKVEERYKNIFKIDFSKTSAISVTRNDLKFKKSLYPIISFLFYTFSRCLNFPFSRRESKRISLFFGRLPPSPFPYFLLLFACARNEYLRTRDPANNL